MPYAINHVHIRAADPHASAAWYEKYFEARKVSEREVMPGTITIGMEVGGPTRLNVSSKPAGSSDERSAAELNRLGLEHFGFHVDDLEAELAKFQADGIRIVLPLTEVTGGTKLAYIEGPDDVLIELVQPAA
jgi:catechol 2,3-dioxygenase-like lactoylglutathione lyase family enzyme